jgi:hypothetical protein
MLFAYPTEQTLRSHARDNIQLVTYICKYEETIMMGMELAFVWASKI